jgi:hypothetical protein
MRVFNLFLTKEESEYLSIILGQIETFDNPDINERLIIRGIKNKLELYGDNST